MQTSRDRTAGGIKAITYLVDYTGLANLALPISAYRCPCHCFFVCHTGQRLGNMQGWSHGAPSHGGLPRTPMLAWAIGYTSPLGIPKTSVRLP